MVEARSYIRKNLTELYVVASPPRNLIKIQFFTVSPPQAPKKFGVFGQKSDIFPPHLADPGGEIIISPPPDGPWGGNEKSLPPHLGGEKNTPAQEQ